MICNQLQHLQDKFAALLVASDEQETLLRGVIPVENKGAVKAFRKELEKRLAEASSELAAHVYQHGCAN